MLVPVNGITGTVSGVVTVGLTGPIAMSGPGVT